MNETFSLKGKVALVTGAGRGLGRSMAVAFAKAGASLLINDGGSPQEANGVKAEIEKLGQRAVVVLGDVSDEVDVRELFVTVRKEFGGLDILVNNAGISEDKDIFTTTLDDWNRMLKINLTGTFLCSKFAMEIMREQMRGRIIQISSVTGEQGAIKGHIHYATTKSGLLGFTKTLARTAAPFGITVNAIAPGIIETDLLRKVHGPSGVEQMRSQVPLGLGTGADVASTAVFLASDEARYITGATFDVNGGLYFR